VTTLAPGNNTFAAKYRASAGACTILNRSLIVTSY
jgi:hypothetical protein